MYIVCFIKYQLDSAAIELMLAMFCIKTGSGTNNKLCICKDAVWFLKYSDNFLTDTNI